MRSSRTVSSPRLAWHAAAVRLIGFVFGAVALAACASRGAIHSEAAGQGLRDDFGVLVMAHGGSAQWDREVLAAVEPLKARYNIEVAFGMADPATLQQGVQRLEEHWARRIGVVRLFISGESFKERTQQILGIIPGAPPAPASDAHSGHDHASHDHGDGMAFWKLNTQASFALRDEGLVDAPEMGAVLAERARALSHQPQREDVLILAHGPEDDAQNARWLAQLNARAAIVRHSLPFRRVQVETLREDWPEKRAAAERRIRAFIERAAERGGTAIVIPFRVQGFGPYERVLNGLHYVSDGTGLLPHPNVTQWIERQIVVLQGEAFGSKTS